jgi:hypothetical protein
MLEENVLVIYFLDTCIALLADHSKEYKEKLKA